jgi:hypothetical protein
MKHPLATMLALSLGTATLWMVTLAQLPRRIHVSRSINGH